MRYQSAGRADGVLGLVSQGLPADAFESAQRQLHEIP